MNKSIKLLAALLIIGTAFTACKKEETAPQVSIQDFEGTYKYINPDNGVLCRLVAATRTTFGGVEVVELELNGVVAFVDLTRRDANSFTGNYIWNGGQIGGNVVLFVDSAGVRKFSLEFTNTGEIHRAVEVQ